MGGMLFGSMERTRDDLRPLRVKRLLNGDPKQPNGLRARQYVDCHRHKDLHARVGHGWADISSVFDKVDGDVGEPSFILARAERGAYIRQPHQFTRLAPYRSDAA